MIRPNCFGKIEELNECWNERALKCIFYRDCLGQVLGKMSGENQLREKYNEEEDDLEYTLLKKGLRKNKEFVEKLWNRDFSEVEV